MHRVGAAAVIGAVATPVGLWSGPPSAGAQAGCRFVRGFVDLHQRLGGVDGGCVDDEHDDPNGTGDRVQTTTTGYMVWQKATNTMRWTDGYRTLTYRSCGLQERRRAPASGRLHCSYGSGAYPRPGSARAGCGRHGARPTARTTQAARETPTVQKPAATWTVDLNPDARRRGPGPSGIRWSGQAGGGAICAHPGRMTTPPSPDDPRSAHGAQTPPGYHDARPALNVREPDRPVRMDRDAQCSCPRRTAGGSTQSGGLGTFAHAGAHRSAECALQSESRGHFEGSPRRPDSHLGPAWRPPPGLAVVLALALGVRLAFAWPALAGARGPVGDEGGYVQLALSVGRELAFALDGTPTATRLPLFPAFLAPFYLVDGRTFSPLPAVLALGLGICWATYALGRRLFDPRVGLLGALLAAADLHLAMFSGYLLSESLYVLLALVGLLGVVEARRRRSVRRLALAGAICGLALLTGPEFVPLAAVVVGWTLVAWGPDGRGRLMAAAVLLIAIAAVWAPWPARNLAVFGRFVPLTSQPCPPCVGIYHDGAADPSDLRTFGQWQPTSWPDGLGELEAGRFRRDRAIRWIREHPALAAAVALAQAPHFWRPTGLGLGALGPVAWVTYLVLLAAAGRGLMLALGRNRQDALLWTAVAVGLTAFSVVTIGDPRHRLVLHPVLNVLAAAAVVHAARPTRGGLGQVRRLEAVSHLAAGQAAGPSRMGAGAQCPP